MRLVTWTASTYKAAYPEFDSLDDSMVDRVLGSASLRCDVRLFGAKTDDAVALYAGHLLTIAPMGQQSRLSIGEDRYYAEWLIMARVAGGGPWNAGQFPR